MSSVMAMGHRSLLHPGVIAALVSLLGPQAATGALAAVKRRSALHGCTVSAPEQSPLLSSKAGNGTRQAEDLGDDPDDDDDDDEADGSDAPAGFYVPGSDTCVSISGTLSTGMQYDWYRIKAPAAGLVRISPDVTTFPITASLRLESGQALANGLYLSTAIEFMFDTTSDDNPTVEEASITLGPFTAGVTASWFDFWTGEDFVLVGRIPSRTVGLFGVNRRLTDTLQFSLSAETLESNQSALGFSRGARMPDGVARLLYDDGTLTIHGAVALHDQRLTGDSSRRLGRAAIIGATWQHALFGRNTILSGQIAGAIDAAPYIGSQLDRRAVLPLLAIGHATRGWSGVLSIGHDLSDTWSTNAYVSRYDLKLPFPGSEAGHIRIDRLSANLVWKPFNGIKIGVEGSTAWQNAEILGRVVSTSLAGRQTSLQVFLERAF
ncbi:MULTISPECIES: porin [unclassified Chelatococcus]|uniref:porin n=1 Tax=unclassified Chelatococcus TaxID=2638111 RepID=UPI001BCDE674|nr:MULTISPECIES: porin [unclassified Chelatococcus]CAH1652485.1 Porin (modular protein) [Hyphomicrobiales bacterium]MBS7739990.1 porin [Chelatococcus sp. HY11]MBX3547001.1 porin [Chelatococcus sp.]MCO5078710.1 porin [Chelatococcus sp.]CAH1685976.1 Porin (modular protein) [Hyphomicrobiales bacterium]